MYPILFELFGRPVSTYGVMVVLGFTACILLGSRLIKRYDISIYDFALTFVVAGLSLAVVSCLVYGLSNIRGIIYAFSHFEELKWKEFFLTIVRCFSGIVFYGGFIGGAIGIVIYTKYAKDVKAHRDHLLDIYAVLTPLFHTFGRIGCFFGGCCYGIESRFGFTVHDNPLNPYINDVNRLPIQLIESGCNFILFLVLLYLFRKRILEKRLIYVYMLTYPVIRFTDEFFRGDFYRGFFFGLSTSQWISIFLFVFALIMLPRKNRIMKREKEQAEQTPEPATEPLTADH